MSAGIEPWVRAWERSLRFERWLEEVVWSDSDGHYHEIRGDWDDQDRWYWFLPNFEVGRTAVVGVEGVVLRSEETEVLRSALEAAHWAKRIGQEHLLVRRSDSGGLVAAPWDPPVDDAWHPDPLGGHFVTYIQSPRSMHPGELFLAMDAKTWSAMGPKSPRGPKSYSDDELAPYLPKTL